MQSWDAIGITERVIRTYVMPPAMRAAGITITTCVVTQALYENSAAPDASPNVLDGTRVINAAPITYKGQTIAANQAVLQPVKGDVANATYVITFTMALSNGDLAFVEDCLLPISTHVPP